MARSGQTWDEMKIARLREQGAGAGKGKAYKPWLTVRRVASKGRSHRPMGRTTGRVHHFLYSKNGCGTPGHIRGSEAAGMAKELAGFIETLPDVWED